MSCEHRQLQVARCEVNYLADTEKFRADLKIACAECGVPFRFKGVRPGYHPSQPSVSFAGEELRLPIEPMDIDGPVHPELLAETKKIHGIA